MTLVVDASVAVKWFLPEVHSESAEKVLQSGQDLLVPDLLFAEVANVLWKRVQAKELTIAEAKQVLAALLELKLTFTPSETLAPTALEIACQTKRTVYDSLYLALASLGRAKLVTADRKLYQALQSTKLKAMVQWIEDSPP